MPSHVAIIMDGNGRWAEQKSLPRILGHKYGVETVKRIIRVANKLGIKILTLYAFSTENWKRPYNEINYLFLLLSHFMKKEIYELHNSGIRLRILGDLSKFPVSIRREINKVCSIIPKKVKLELNMALNYGSRQELIHAFKKMFKRGIKNPTEKIVSSFLYTSGQPDPDLLIRTSGEFRISNFLLWQIAYSEIYITRKFWPDFTEQDFKKAILEYQKRERRFGGLKPKKIK
ncbi:MAG: isoprenyl transferase [Endomicrobium sp.]|nr:isoprenyl transferase [Endomicrobium sp.]